MPRKKKERGRPMERSYPPRIDATPEEIARALLSGPAVEVGEEDYRCAECEREVRYPEILYRDGRCERCHKAPVV